MILYLDHHAKAITGGHKYNDSFESYLQEISGVKIYETPSCAYTYRGWRKCLSPFAEQKWLKFFKKDTLVFFGDTSYKHLFLLAFVNYVFSYSQTAVIIHHFLFIGTSGMMARINKWLMLKYYGIMDNIIVPSPYTLDVAKEYFPNKRIHYIPLPFERHYEPSSEYCKGNFLYVGTVEERKGLIYLIEALGLIKDKKQFTLNIVGKICEQSYYDILVKRIDELGISNNVNFLGRVSDSQLEECYKQAEIFTFPSLLEGYGIVLIEALKHGVPVICFNNTAMPYTIKDGFNGYVVDNLDVTMFANRICELSGNEELRCKMQNGIENTISQLKTKADFREGIRWFYNSI